jgi:UDP:flavonoid glycosyltransferase YjiC (YdhE family)
MPRFLFFSLPLIGHADWGGMLATCLELAQRGQQVAWASGDALAPALAGKLERGVEFITLAHTGWNPPPHRSVAPAEEPGARQARALEAWLNPNAVQLAVAALEQAMADWRPDVLVVEPYAAAGALAAERHSLALAVCGRPALMGQTPGPAAPWVEALCRQSSVPGRYWNVAAGQIRSPWLHLDFFSRRWYGDLRQVGRQTRFFGSAPAPVRPEAARARLVLITLGTLFNDDPVFFQVAAQAVLAAGGQPLLVTGRRGALAGVPAAETGVAVTDWVDFDAVLPQAAGVIHHGGVGVTHAALRHAAPQVAVPRAGDQLVQAGRITQAGVGYGVRPADFTPASAPWFARQLLEDEPLRRQAHAWQTRLSALGGPHRAADELQQTAVIGDR